MFLMSLGFSIVLTGVWPYLDKVQFKITNIKKVQNYIDYFILLFQLDRTAGKEYMGYVVAANPLGQMLFSPLVGWWGNKRGSVRLPLLITLLLFICASAMYSILEILPGDRKALMASARFLVGVSSG